MLRDRGDASSSSSSSSSSSDASSDASGWRLLLSHKNESLYNAFALEVAVASPGSRALTTGLFALPAPLPPSTLTRMAGTRAVLCPLACGEDADDVLAAVDALPVAIDLPGSIPVALHYDCVARRASRDRVSSQTLTDALRETMKTWGGGFEHGMYARFDDPTTAEATDAARRTLRFVLAETSRGYVFGLATFAPPRPLAKCDWNRKPNNYSAGLRQEIAAAAVNVAMMTRGGGGGGGDADVVIDPCCGGGTILHAAWARGHRAVGGELIALNASNARGNIASFRPHMPALHASLLAIDDDADAPAANEGRGGKRTLDATTGLLSPPPVVLDNDATAPTDWAATVKATTGREDARVAAIVSNLPFGRQVAVGGGPGGGKRGGATDDEYAPLLRALRDHAPRHVFISGVPIAAAMREVGYEGVVEIALCRRGRTFMTVAAGAGDVVPTPSTAFSAREAARAKAEDGYVHAATPDWVAEAEEEEECAAASGGTPRPPLRVAIDASYEQDSQRAIRSGAFYTLVHIRPRWRGERRSLRTFPGASLRTPLAFNPRPRRL